MNTVYIYKSTDLFILSECTGRQYDYLAFTRNFFRKLRNFLASSGREFAEASLGFNTFWYCTIHQFDYNLYEFKNKSQICIMINTANKAIIWKIKVRSH